MEEKKSNRGLKVLIVVLIMIILGATGVIYCGYNKYRNLENDNKNLSSKYDSISKELNEVNNKKNQSNNLEKRYILNNPNGKHDELEYNIYAISDSAQIIAYEGEIYLVNNYEDAIVNEWINSCLNEAKFKDNKYTCKIGEGDESSTYLIEKTGIKETEIYAASVTNNLSAQAPMIYNFIIYSDGKAVTYKNGKAEEVFKSYKVKNVQVYCAEKLETSCKWGYKLLLTDGTTKELTTLE